MMEFATLKAAAAAVGAIGIIGGGVLTLDQRHAPREEVTSLKSELRVDRIFSLAEQARNQGSPDWLCVTLEKEFARLCTDDPNQHICEPEPRQKILERAGCST